MNELASHFINPSAAYRGKPFWSWNGDLKEDELIRQVHVMKEMGLGGFFMHSRTGLITEYLGDEWFRLTNACADEAEKLGLEAWLYDEDRWPSGTAGGMVTANPDFQLRYMKLTPIPAESFAWSEGITAAFACALDGYSYSGLRRITGDTPPASYAGATVLVFEIEPMAPSSFYNGNTYVDTMNLAATEHYIAITHDRYKQRCGDRLGKSIQGVFTDEPHRGSVFTGFSVPNADRLWMTPWTAALPEKYAELFGEDLIEKLPELFLRPEGRAVSPIKWRYMELMQQLFLDNFARPLYEWCGANGMRLTGHVLHEDSLTAQTAMQGSLMRFYEYMHDPGVDVLSESNRNYVVVKQLTSAARQLGQTWLLSELYGCTGWQMNFRSHKEVGDWQALFGINLRCHHLSWYTMEGEAKRDFPGSILHQSAWWRDYEYVESYYARLGLLLNQGKPRCDVLVLNPIESLWCQIGVGWASDLSPLTPEIQKLEAEYAELSTWLLGEHIDYDYGDEEMIGRLSSIEQDAGGQALLRVGQATYLTVVVGQMTTMRSSTLRLLEAFADAGGSVIFAGAAPEYVDAVLSTEPASLSERAARAPWDRSRIAAAIHQAIPRGPQIVDPESGHALSDIFCQMRIDGDRHILVALNINPQREFERAVVRMPGHGAVEEWDCRTGERRAIATQPGCCFEEFETTFAVSGERAYVLTPTRDPSVLEAPKTVEAGRQICDGPFEYELAEDNVCVLDFARFRLDEGEWSERAEILKIDQAVRAALEISERGGEMVQPWFHAKFHPAPPVRARLALEYLFTLESAPDKPVTLAIERPKQWRISLNGQAISSDADGWWVDAAFEKLALPAAALQTGENILTLEIPFHAAINLEALYLLGDFGVRQQDSHVLLTRRPKRLHVGDITEQGFPFYGGSLTYAVPLPPLAEGRRVFVETSGFEAACIKVRRAGGADAMIAFPPYRAEATGTGDRLELEVVLTRRNTFGPLHQLPLRSHAYGPGNFTTGGAHFTNDYMLYPAGLLEAPVISWADTPQE
ncbi:hypothetical protein [Capsulimonas corticalis]|uniref:hypothetical protein n=1 Tax=Capsulimonas corticalis TaxID=2219043 RepID=UPI000E6469E1|nr:hypothetical protein [Capsulimonas corticalis]